MFDKTIIQQGQKEYVPYVKEIKRAPTDKSVELLNEFMDKARKNIVDRAVISNNFLEATYCAFQCHITEDYIIHYKIKLNHKIYEGKIVIPIVRMQQYARTRVVNLLCEELKDIIYKEITHPFFKTIINDLGIK